MSILTTIVTVCLSILGVSSLMEIYKKTIRKGQAKPWENWVVGGVLSLVTAGVFNWMGLIKLPFSVPFIVSTLICGVVIFFVQMFVDMKIVKTIIRAALLQIDANTYVNTILSKVGLTVEQINEFLSGNGVTKEKFKEYLVAAGVSEDSVEILVKLLYIEK